jgi:hypothetical protein
VTLVPSSHRPTIGPANVAARSRSFEVSAQVTVHTDADLDEPFARVAVFRALVEQLKAAQLRFDTPHGAATVSIGLVTAVS